MKILSCLIVLFLSLPGNPNTGTNQRQSEEARRSSEFDWLLGNWKRDNDRPGRSTFEHWTKISKTEYHGLSYTLRNGDTIFKEEIRLLKRDKQWIFEVSGVNEDPTLFLFIKQSKLSFTTENDKNEFPKFIEYSLVGKKLVAKIYGGGQEILFSYQKLRS